MTLLYVVAGAASMGVRGALMGAAKCIMPLCAIWFAEEWGGRFGDQIRYHTLSTKTPGTLMHFGGWLILLGGPLIAGLLSLR